MKTPLPYKLLSLPLLSLLAALNAQATTYNVSSISDLTAKIGIAVAGDTIIVANGSYTTTGAINVSRAGAAGAPILIQAQTVGGVEIKGSGTFSFNSGASYVTVQGFKFTDSNSLSISSGANHIRVTRNIFELTLAAGADESYININGDDVEIDHNELRNKSTLGEMLDIAGSGSQVARRLWVHHNYFHDFTSPGGNGAETIRWGLSGLSLSTGDGLCEYNLFVRCTGENELISNKSSGNTYRYNTFLDSPGAQMSQRHGDDCVYYGNYFRNTDGLRVYGNRHQIFANYFEGNTTGVDMGNGDGQVEDGAPLDSHDEPNDCVVSFNTFITNSTHYKMTGRTGGLGASNIVVADNIFQGNGSLASISGSAPYIGTWSGNIRWNNSNPGNMPSSGYTTVNPLLAKDANGVYHIQSGSPAIGAALGSYPAATVDMDGQPRGSVKDVGADEFSSATIVAKLLTTNDVGLSASNFPSGVFSWEAEFLSPAANGATTTPQTDVNASGGNWLALNADGAGDWIQFTTPSVPAGSYDVTMSYKAHPSRGILQLSVDGSNLGTTLDEYSASIVYTQRTFGTVTFASAGYHTIRLTVTGINGASGGYTLAADAFTLSVSTNLPQVNTPSFSPGAGTYTSVQSVSISTTTSGASIRYTTDGSTPSSTSGTLYSSPVSIGVTTTLKAIAYKTGMSDSLVISSNYTISIPDFTISATPGSQTVAAGNSTNYTVNVGNINAFSGTIAFSVAGLPANATGVFSPTSVTAPGSSTLTINTTTSTPVSSSNLTITGTSGSLSHNANVTLNVTAAASSNLFFEAESLTVTDSGVGTSLQSDVNSSGGAWVELMSTAVGNWMEFTLPNIPAGTYSLKMKYKGNTTRGQLSLKVDGVQLGTNLDQYSAAQTYPELTFGAVTFTSTGNHAVRLTVTGKNSSSSSFLLSADDFTLTRVSGGTTVAFEAESAAVTNSGVGTSLQSDVNSSGGTWVQLNATAVGDWMEFTTPTLTTGAYSFSMMWKGNTTRGISDFFVDGVQLGNTLDQYSAAQTYPTTVIGSLVFSSSATHKIRMHVTGKNAASSNFLLSADKFTFTAQ